MINVTCPTCGVNVIWNDNSPYRPFCSKRCQLIDLGEWANEEKYIPAPPDLTLVEEWDNDIEH